MSMGATNARYQAIGLPTMEDHDRPHPSTATAAQVAVLRNEKWPPEEAISHPNLGQARAALRRRAWSSASSEREPHTELEASRHGEVVGVIEVLVLGQRRVRHRRAVGERLRVLEVLLIAADDQQGIVERVVLIDVDLILLV